MLKLAWITTLLTLVAWSGVWFGFYLAMLGFLSLTLWTSYMVNHGRRHEAIVLIWTTFCAILVGLGHHFSGLSAVGLMTGLIMVIVFWLFGDHSPFRNRLSWPENTAPKQGRNVRDPDQATSEKIRLVKRGA